MQSDTQILSGCGLKRLPGTMQMARKTFPIPVSVTKYSYQCCPGLPQHFLGHVPLTEPSYTYIICPMCPMQSTYTALIPLSIPSQSPGTTWDIPDMSQVSHGRVPKSRCPSHPRVPGLLGISQTCPKCPMVECPNPTVHPIPESRDYLGYPRHVPSVPC